MNWSYQTAVTKYTRAINSVLDSTWNMADREKEKKGVDSVTDYVEEKEIEGDTEKIKQGLNAVTSSSIEDAPSQT